ncbi:MAG: hypothetical protein KatS3mg021_1123 [Fimbriimonadales bacterium]|nr:MAG: hypothetical protein KatS3mg021_1123 [Fimbriimonadales bacterium]
MSNEEKSPQETVAPETAPEVTPEAQEAVAAEQPEAAQTEAAESQSEAAESQLAAAAEAPAPAKRELPPPPVITGLIGRKLGMTHIFDEQGRMVAVTAVELGPCYVVQVRTPERDGYLAVQVGFGEQKRQRVNKPMQGIFRKAELPRPLRYLREFRVIEGQPASGQEIRAEHVFQVGEIVKVTRHLQRQGVRRGRAPLWVRGRSQNARLDDPPTPSLQWRHRTSARVQRENDARTHGRRARYHARSNHRRH